MFKSKFLKFLLLFVFLIWIVGYGFFIAKVLRFEIDIPTAETDAIIVLTGGKNRINTGLELFADGKAPKLLITGVHPKSPDADILSMWKDENKPLPDCCITLGREATTTIENAIEAKGWIDQNNVKVITLVTSDYHMPRALKEFWNVIPTLRILPYPVSKEDNLLSTSFWYLSFSEYNKNLFRDAVLYIEKNFMK
tara:strand:- start:2251 stop:2835 length:585 start_codon:yes stop_codon:yes gene_type:complete